MFELDNWRDHQWEHHHKFSSSWLDSNQNYRFTRSGTGSRGNQVGGEFSHLCLFNGDLVICACLRGIYRHSLCICIMGMYSHVCLLNSHLQAYCLFYGNLQA